MSGKADIGLVGLAVMGENLVLNMESKGFTVACYNRTTSKVDEFVNGRAKGKRIVGAPHIASFRQCEDHQYQEECTKSFRSHCQG